MAGCGATAIDREPGLIFFCMWKIPSSNSDKIRRLSVVNTKVFGSHPFDRFYLLWLTASMKIK